MSENCYKKNMLLKEKEKKYRVLAVEKEKVLVIDNITTQRVMQIVKHFLKNIIIGRSKKDENSGFWAGVLVEMIDNVNRNAYN